jgi:hypothetical protein
MLSCNAFHRRAMYPLHMGRLDKCHDKLKMQYEYELRKNE